MKLCPYCKKKIHHNCRYCYYCNKNLTSYKIYKMIFSILLFAPLTIYLIFSEKLNFLLVEKLSVKHTTIVYIILYTAWGYLIDFFEKKIFQKI